MSAISGNRGVRSLCAWRAVLAVSAMLVAAASFAQAPNSIDQVTVSKGSSGNTIVRFALKGPPANPPAGFSISSPPRIALDFLDTSNALGATQRIVDDVAFIQAEHGFAIGREIERRGIRKQYYLETRCDVLIKNL